MKAPGSGLLAAAAALALVAAGGCSHYSFSPAMRTHISTVSVPVLENETLDYGAGQAVTDAIIDVLSDDGTLRVVEREDADSIIRGAVVTYERVVMSYDAGGTPRDYKVRAVVRLAFEDLTRAEVVWEQDVEGWAVYSEAGAGEELTSEDEARSEAFRKIAQDVLALSVQGW